MTEVIYLEVFEKTEAAKKAGRRVSVSGMLKFLGVSRSEYLAWLHHVPSDTEKRRKAVKAKIQDIYDDSKQNYGAPKITKTRLTAINFIRSVWKIPAELRLCFFAPSVTL